MTRNLNEESSPSTLSNGMRVRKVLHDMMVARRQETENPRTSTIRPPRIPPIGTKPVRKDAAIARTGFEPREPSNASRR